MNIKLKNSSGDYVLHENVDYIQVRDENDVQHKIELEPTYLEKTVTENGIYIAANEGVSGYKKIIVDTNPEDTRLEAFITDKAVLLPDVLVQPRQQALAYCTNISNTHLTIDLTEHTVKDIFAHCNLPNLTVKYISSNNTVTGHYASLIQLPATLKKLDLYSLVGITRGQYFCTGSIPTVILPKYFYEGMYLAVYNNSLVNNLVLPTTLSSMENECILKCSALNTLYILRTVPPTMKSATAIRGTPLNDLAEGAKIYVPTGSLEAYQTAANWSSFASIMEEMPIEEMEAVLQAQLDE